MSATLTPFIAGWIALACAVAGLALYRRVISGQDDEMLHVRDSESAHISHQSVIAHRLETIDRWGKTLTVVVAALGVLLAVAYLYQVWMAGFSQM